MHVLLQTPEACEESTLPNAHTSEQAHKATTGAKCRIHDGKALHVMRLDDKK